MIINYNNSMTFATFIKNLIIYLYIPAKTDQSFCLYLSIIYDIIQFNFKYIARFGKLTRIKNSHRNCDKYFMCAIINS